MKFNYFKNKQVISFEPQNPLIILTDIDDEFEQEFCVDEETFKLYLEYGGELVDNQFVIHIHDATYKSALLENKPPKIDELEYTNKVNISGDVVKELLKFVATSNNRPVLTGIHFDTDGYAVATDSYFLCRSKIGNISKSFTIPVEFAKVISSGIIEYNDTSCKFITGRTTYISQLINIEYPKVNNIFVSFHPECEIKANLTPYLKLFSNLELPIELNGKTLKYVNFEKEFELPLECDLADTIRFQAKVLTHAQDLEYSRNILHAENDKFEYIFITMR